MEKTLVGKTVAILVANGFKEVDMTEPQRALLAAGAKVRLVSPENGVVNGWHEAAWGHYFPVDQALSSALAADFDALLMPGGVRGIDKLAQNAHTIRFVRGFVDGSKPVALFGEAVGLLAAAERAKGVAVCAQADGTALAGAGATVGEDPIAVDGAILTIAADTDEAAVKDAIEKNMIEPLQSVAEAA